MPQKFVPTELIRTVSGEIRRRPILMSPAVNEDLEGHNF